MALAAALGSVLVVIVLLFIKTVAYMATGSASVLASLIDSLTDAAVSLMNFAAIRLSLKPADDDHRFGHGKIEGIAALMQAAFIGGSAVFLALEAISRLTRPVIVTDQVMAITVIGIATILSIILVMFQNYSLRHAPSLAIESDRAHYASDIVMNGAVIMALVLQAKGAPGWVDPVFALFVALWMCRTVYIVGCKGTDMLMDRELPEDIRNQIEGIIRNHPDVLDFHDLRTRATGMQLDISLDIEVASDMTLREAHDIAKAVEGKLLSVFPNAEIMIHVDPAGDPEDSRHTNAGRQDA